MNKRRGRCLCGKVTYSVNGEPTRVGICHCTDCRQESGSAFTYFGIWPASAFESLGETGQYEGRRYCPSCGSRLFAYDSEEAEIKLGSLLDAPTSLAPSYELWIKRREPWLPALPGAEQYDEDRTRGKSRMENASKELADEYRQLGGRRIAVIDDNIGSSRDWDGDTPEADAFWNAYIAPLPERERRDVETFLPSLNDEQDEPGV